ncbi:unnamed protein product [Orchesella dallaii]|uniref:Platelet-derived growth factor (PDGF) family profile domain-containing protein n=1 Tax=Orchesella dallaii TaxID=48710 RepID=A0ABP1PYE3_9HEXA
MISKYNGVLVITGLFFITILLPLVTSISRNSSSVIPLKRSLRSVKRDENVIQRCIGCNDDSGGHCTRKTFKTAKQYAGRIKCQPEPTFVKLNVPGPSFSLEPSVAKVNRCSGVCKLSYHSCMPTKTSFLKVPVILMDHHHKTPKCVEYEVEEHDECSCDCQVREEQCSEFHKHDRCACQCTNIADMIACLEKQPTPGQRSVWDEDKCQCVCEAEPCPENFEWDSSKCRCEVSPWIEADNMLF